MLSRDDLDAILVLASGNHFPLALAALERGSHVLVEKPLCFRIGEANALVAEAQRRGLILMVGYTRWFEAAYQQLQELLKTSLEPPLLARILTVQTPESLYLQHHRMVSWNSEAGIALRVDERARELGDELEGIPVEGRAFYLDMLLDNSIHDLSVVRGLLGGRPRLEAAALDPSRAAFHVSWRFSGEVRCEYDFVLTDRVGGRYEQRVELIGDAYRAVLSYPSPYVRYSSARLTVERVDQAGGGTEESTWWGGPSDAVERELLHFEMSVRNGAAGMASGSEGTIDIALLQEVIRHLWGAQRS
jgi:predicted dehydrogenase